MTINGKSLPFFAPVLICGLLGCSTTSQHSADVARTELPYQKMSGFAYETKPVMLNSRGLFWWFVSDDLKTIYYEPCIGHYDIVPLRTTKSELVFKITESHGMAIELLNGNQIAAVGAVGKTYRAKVKGDHIVSFEESGKKITPVQVYGMKTSAVETSACRAQAELIVEQMRGISMQERATISSDGRVIHEEQRKKDIKKKLRVIGEPAIPTLVRALNDADVQMRRNAALVLWDLAGAWESGANKVDTREAIPGLIKAAEDRDDTVRAWAAGAIGEIGPDATAAVPVLIQLVKDPDEGPRNNSCLALGHIGPVAKEALPALREALSDSSKDVRRFAEGAIKEIQGDGQRDTVKR